MKPGSLKAHLKTHAHERPHACDLCDARFTRRGDLERHIKVVHNKDRPFKCSKCHRTFGDKKNLRWHLSNHDRKLFHHCQVWLIVDFPPFYNFKPHSFSRCAVSSLARENIGRTTYATSIQFLAMTWSLSLPTCQKLVVKMKPLEVERWRIKKSILLLSIRYASKIATANRNG